MLKCRDTQEPTPCKEATGNEALELGAMIIDDPWESCMGRAILVLTEDSIGEAL